MFNIPCACCTDIIGEEISARTGGSFMLEMDAKHISSTASNVIVRMKSERKHVLLSVSLMELLRANRGTMGIICYLSRIIKPQSHLQRKRYLN